MGKNANRLGRRWLFIACAASAAVLVAFSVAALHAGNLLHETLDGRKTGETEAHVTHFSLREQMMKGQADTRVRGWLSIVHREEIVLDTKRGMLSASLFEPIHEDEFVPWALVLHGGLGTNRNQVTDVACELSLAGYRVLTPDLYAHGTSDGEIASLGLADAQDVQAWVQWITERDPLSRIVIFGQDEGGFAALTASAQGLPPQVCAVAADSAYVSTEARMLDLLESDSRVDEILLSMSYRLEHGVDVGEGELLQRLADCDLPLLLIHGTGDAEIPAWHSEDLAAAGNDARLLFVEGAAHGMARYADSETYYAALLDFYEKALGES